MSEITSKTAKSQLEQQFLILKTVEDVDQWGAKQCKDLIKILQQERDCMLHNWQVAEKECKKLYEIINRMETRRKEPSQT